MKRITLGSEFWIWIAGGFAVIAVAGVILSNTCSVAREPLAQWTGQNSNQQGNEQKRASDQSTDALSRVASALNRISTRLDTIDRRAEQHERHEYEAQPEPEISLCRTKVADLALVFFTYCLVVVGYFTIRRGEKNVRDLERAIVLGGPSVAVPHPANPLLPLANINVLNGHATVIMTMQNFGRTPALIQEYAVKFRLDEPLETIPEYGGAEVIKFDMGLPPGISIPARVAPFHSPFPAAQYVFGYVKYLDMFRVQHTSRFCMKITPGAVDAEIAGSKAYNEWD